MKQQISLQNASYLNQMMRNFNQLEEVRKSKNSNEPSSNTPLQLNTPQDGLNPAAKLPPQKNVNNQLTPKGHGYLIDQGFQNRYGNSQNTPKQLESHSVSSDVYPTNISSTPQQNNQKTYSNQVNQFGNSIQQVLSQHSQTYQQQQQSGLNSSGLNTSANFIKASKLENKQQSQVRSSGSGISYIKDRRTTVDVTPSYMQKGNLKNYYVPSSQISQKEASSLSINQNQQNSFINNSGYSNQQNQQLSTTNKQLQNSQVVINNSSNNLQSQLQNTANPSSNSNNQVGSQQHQASPQQQQQQNQQQYQQANFYELQTPKQRYNYSRSMTDNYPNSSSKLQSQSNQKEINSQQQQQQQQQQYQQNQQQTSVNQFPSQYSVQNSAKSTYSQQNSKQYQNSNNNNNNNNSSNYQQQQYYQIQNTQGMQSQQQQNQFSNSQVIVQSAQSQGNTQIQFNSQQQNEKQINSDSSQKNLVAQQNQQQYGFSQIKNSYNTQKKNLNSSNMQPNGSTSLSNITDTSNVQSNNNNQQSVSSSSINMYNPYSLKKLTPTKTRQHHSINQRSGLNIETNNLNYGNLNSPYINSLSISSVRSAANQSNSSSSRNPYNLGLYSNKSLSKSKDLSLVRQSSSDSQKQLQTQQQQTESPLSSDIANEKTNPQQGVANPINQTQSNSQNNNNKSKSPKLSTASFAQLKSPISSNKVFLSPQSKFTLGFNNNTSVTSRKQSSGSENINIFQMQSISHSHINSSHSALRHNSNQVSNSNKLLSTSTQALPSSSQMNSINLTSQQAGANNQQKTKSNNSAHNNANNQSDLMNRNNNNSSSSSNNNNNNNNTSSTTNNGSSSSQQKADNSQSSFSSSSSGVQTALNNNYIVKSSVERIEIDTNDFTKDLSQISNKSGLNSKIFTLQQPNSDEIPYEETQTANLQNSIIDLINTTVIPNHEKTKYSVKRNGIVKSYAANTNQGLIRNYNEDRVSIILNIMKPQGKNTETDVQWPKCSFFGVYDGHGGVTCADFLRDNLHQFVIKDSNFPKNPRQAIINGFEAAEKQFLKQAQLKEGQVEKSGSCAIVVMIVGTRCYVANVGDSRAIMSGSGGQRAYELSRDHKPLDDYEQKRIQEAGGKIYQTKIMNFQNAFGSASSIMGMSNLSQPIYGPHRVLPGRLSVTRTFGDIEAKLPKLGGNPNVVIAVPDIKEFEIQDDFDFILLASDGIFDKLTTKESIESIWHQVNYQKMHQYTNVHEFCGLAVDTIMKFSLGRKTMDNITVVLIGFDNLKRQLFPNKNKQKNQNIEQNQNSSNQKTQIEKNQQPNSYQQQLQQSSEKQEDVPKKQLPVSNQQSSSAPKINVPSKASQIQSENFLQLENTQSNNNNNNKYSLHVANENQYNLSMSPYSKATPKENGIKFQMNQNSENQNSNNNQNFQQENKQQYLQNQIQYQSQQIPQQSQQQQQSLLYQQSQNQALPNTNQYLSTQQNLTKTLQNLDKTKSRQPLTPGASSMQSQGISFQSNEMLSVRASANPPNVSSLVNNQKNSSYNSSYNNFISNQLGNNYGKQGQSDNFYQQQQVSQQISSNSKLSQAMQQQQSQQNQAQQQQSLQNQGLIQQQEQNQISIKSPYSQQNNNAYNQKYGATQIQGQQIQQQQDIKQISNTSYNKN